MKYYAHTAEDENGKRLPESSGKWQALSTHLRNVAELAGHFAAPFHASEEASIAGLMHELGKYRDEFQGYLRGQRASSAETQHAIFGAAWAADERRTLPCSVLAIAGHHAGLHNRCDIEGMITKRGMCIPERNPSSVQNLPRQNCQCNKPDVVYVR